MPLKQWEISLVDVALWCVEKSEKLEQEAENIEDQVTEEMWEDIDLEGTTKESVLESLQQEKLQESQEWMARAKRIAQDLEEDDYGNGDEEEISDFEDADIVVHLREPIFRDEIEVQSLIEVGSGQTPAEQATQNKKALSHNFERMVQDAPEPMLNAYEDLTNVPSGIVQSIFMYIDEVVEAGDDTNLSLS